MHSRSVSRARPYLLGVAAVLGLAASPITRADVWGYVDANGVGHYANTQLDPRYVLFFREKATSKDARAMQRTVLPAGKLVTMEVKFPEISSAVSQRLGSSLNAIATFNKSPTFKPLRKILQAAAKTHKVDYELLQAMMAVESGFDHLAVSPKGAVGLLQLMPPTAERFGVRADETGDISTKLTDPRTNVMAGAKYMSYLLRLFPGQIDLAVAAYNAGEGSVKRAGNQVPDYKETQNYVRSVLGLYASLKPGVAIPDLNMIGVKGGQAAPVTITSIRNNGVTAVADAKTRVSRVFQGRAAPALVLVNNPDRARAINGGGTVLGTTYGSLADNSPITAQ